MLKCAQFSLGSSTYWTNGGREDAKCFLPISRWPDVEITVCQDGAELGCERNMKKGNIILTRQNTSRLCCSCAIGHVSERKMPDLSYKTEIE